MVKREKRKTCRVDQVPKGWIHHFFNRKSTRRIETRKIGLNQATKQQKLHEQTLSLIVAMARNGVIGKDNKLPWRLSIDLKRFRALTMAHHIVMGRKTFESIGRLLPGRKTVIVSRNPNFHFEGATVVPSVDVAIEVCDDDPEIFFIGGAEIYRQVMDIVDRIYLTEVDADVDGDAFFPALDRREWNEISQEKFPANELNDYPHRYAILERKHDIN